MDAVLGVFQSISGFFSAVSDVVGPLLSLVGDILDQCRALVFLVGFFGLLLTFLWFFLRYLDKKQLTLPSVMFTLFFFIFLSGNILMLSQGSEASVEMQSSAVAQRQAAAQQPSNTGSAQAVADAVADVPPGPSDEQQPAAEGEPAQAPGPEEPAPEEPAEGVNV